MVRRTEKKNDPIIPPQTSRSKAARGLKNPWGAAPRSNPQAIENQKKLLKLGLMIEGGQKKIVSTMDLHQKVSKYIPNETLSLTTDRLARESLTELYRKSKKINHLKTPAY